MKPLLFILLVLGACGYGAHFMLESREAEVSRAKTAVAKATAERDAAKKENAELTPEFEKVDAELAAVPNSPLSPEDAAPLKAVEARQAEVRAKLDELKARQAAAVADAESLAKMAAAESLSSENTALETARKEVVRLRSEITKQTALAEEMRKVIAKEEAATRGRDSYRSTSAKR